MGIKLKYLYWKRRRNIRKQIAVFTRQRKRIERKIAMAVLRFRIVQAWNRYRGFTVTEYPTSRKRGTYVVMTGRTKRWRQRMKDGTQRTAQRPFNVYIVQNDRGTLRRVQ